MAKDQRCQYCQNLFAKGAGFANHVKACSKKVHARQPSLVPQSDSDQHPLRFLLSGTHYTLPKRVPKTVRRSCAQALTQLLRKCVRDNSSASWIDLLLFGSRALSLPATKSLRKESLPSIIQRNLTDLSRHHHPPRTRPSGDTTRKRELNEERLTALATSLLQNNNVRRAVGVVMGEDALAPMNADTLEALRDKHPPEPEDSDYPPPPEQLQKPPFVTPAEVLQAVLSFPSGSAGGCSDLRPQHLKDMLCGPGAVESELCSALTDFVNHVLHNDIPEDIRPFFFGANLIPLAKKDGGIRPIAVGETFRRLVSKMVSQRCTDKMKELCNRVQFGFGTKGGAEAIIHGMRAYLETPHTEARVIVKLYFKNAFNMLRRDALLRAVREHFPAYYSFFWQSYRFSSHLVCGEEALLSARGVQQGELGDPSGPLGYSLATLPLFPDLDCELYFAFLDDVTLAGTVEKVMSAIKRIQEKAAKLGLELNFRKCEFFPVVTSDAEEAHIRRSLLSCWPEMLQLSAENFSLLGARMTSSACAGFLAGKTKQLQNFVQRLKKLPAHYSLFLLKNCLSILKVLYGLRTSRSYEHAQLLKEYDEMLRLGVEQLVNVKISEAQWTQISLPVRRGGLGTRRIETLAVCAYLASVYSVQHIVSELYQPTEECLTKTAQETWVQLTEGEIPAEFLRKFQFAWDSPVIDRDISILMSSTEGNDRARAVLLAALNKDSRAWLNALPAPCLGTFLRDDDVRIGVALRFGLPVVVAHNCIACGTQVETNGHHGLSCNKSTKGRWARHKEMNSIAKNCCESAGFPCQLEPTGLSSTDGKRPDGMTLIPVRQGRPLVWDVTSWCTVADSHVAASSKNPEVCPNWQKIPSAGRILFLNTVTSFIPWLLRHWEFLALPSVKCCISWAARFGT
ncbi:uncharacterized protein LOC129594623 isoform X1 [Paramacrobiotus metropolitanus]|uniref:uncharacterized protein LOC129594623 isoform X1 n=1 Tax=Paramacrobiotus metropolitanus TaxID=2943436 RepID=UPI0024465133|nr:uncharacterized protein LOC129594623 isoform X1 [Paramacrobiotus metropolitanus]